MSGSGGTATCNVDVDECYVTCGEDECQNTISCPTGTNCEKCIITCSGNDACGVQSGSGTGATVNTHFCQDVRINLVIGNFVGSQMTIYAPAMNGDLAIYYTQGYQGFAHSEIHSTPYAGEQSGKIQIFCSESPFASQQECYSSTINGTTAEYLEFTCYDGAECPFTELYCPLSPYARTDEISCKFDCRYMLV